METKNIIQQGTTAKYAVSIRRESFDSDTDDFAVRLAWGLMGKSMTITKADMTPVKDGRWLLDFKTDDMVGAVTAATMISVSDPDIEGGTMQEVDRQVIAFVVTTPNPRLLMCPGDDGEHCVTFERVTEPDLGEKYQYLRDVKGRRLVTADNHYLLVLTEREEDNINQ